MLLANTPHPPHDVKRAQLVQEARDKTPEPTGLWSITSHRIYRSILPSLPSIQELVRAALIACSFEIRASKSISSVITNCGLRHICADVFFRNAVIMLEMGVDAVL